MTADRHRGCKRRPCNTCKAWQPDEEQLLRQLAGTMPLPDVVAAINAEYGHLRPARSKQAICIRANRMGVLVEYVEGITMRDLEVIVRYSDVSIERHWVQPGLLVGQKVRGKGKDGRWRFLDADLQRFLEDHPQAYDWRRFAPGIWRGRAEVASRRSPWRTVPQLLAYLGLQWPNFWEKRWREIPHVRRHHGSNHWMGSALIHQDQFPEIRASIDPNRYARRGGRKKAVQPATWRRTCRTCRTVTVGQRGEPCPIKCGSCGYALPRRGMAA